MKKLFVVVVVLAMALVGATAAFAGIANSKHDLSNGSTTTIKDSNAVNGLSSCQFCHTPHNANLGMVAAPLWNKTNNVTSYIVYGGLVAGGTGTTLGNTQVGAPGQHSLTCLSCHDGLLSVGATYVNGTEPIQGAGQGASGNGRLNVGNINNIGTTAAGNDLRDDHPVGLVYTPAAPGAGLAAIATIQTLSYKLFAEVAAGRAANSFECASCHEVHDNTTNPPFLRRPKAGMCSECHSGK